MHTRAELDRSVHCAHIVNVNVIDTSMRPPPMAMRQPHAPLTGREAEGCANPRADQPKAKRGNRAAARFLAGVDYRRSAYALAA